MNELELLSKWDEEKPIYSAWGQYVVEYIKKALTDKGKTIDNFLKIPPVYRLKDDSSFVDKAFYRSEKEYTDPYNEIEDKVGARFVVLLVDHINDIHNIIKENETWNYTICRHFEEEREREPLLFTYQSVHCVLRPKKVFNYGGVHVPVDTPCEVQIRTLLQHAHAELTHDSIYKSRKKAKPKVQRTVAKSMALIETTDGFFKEVIDLLDYGPLKKYKVLEKLDEEYYKLTSIKPIYQKSSIIVWDEFEQCVDKNTIGNIQDTITENAICLDIIKSRYNENVLYQQSVILFVFWMMFQKRERLTQDWPLSTKILEMIATDLGFSIGDD